MWLADVPSVPIELATLINAEDEIYIMGGAVGLIEDHFVMLLRCPKTFLDTHIKVEL